MGAKAGSLGARLWSGILRDTASRCVDNELTDEGHDGPGEAMKLSRIIVPLLLLSLMSSGLLAFQRNRIRIFQQQDDDENGVLPTDAREKDEWVFSRFRYSSAGGGDQFGGY